MSVIQSFKSIPSFHSFGVGSFEEIEASEKRLSLRFSEEYKAYLTAFRFVIFDGHELTGLCQSKRLNVVDVTLREKAENANIPKDFYVIEELLIDGIIVWQSGGSGEIYLTQYDSVPQKVADSMEAYYSK